ncbi:MAG TPA: AAA family ATPase [Candidatus Kryptonia bacterium]
MFIRRFAITNYRSLVDFKIEPMEQTTILFGDNNAGKSNALFALYTIFQRKRQVDKEAGLRTFTSPRNFYSGVIENFANDFHNNIAADIEFQVEFSLSDAELDLAAKLKRQFRRRSLIDHNVMVFGGSLVKSDVGEDTAEIVLKGVTLNGRSVYQFDGQKQSFTYFPLDDPTRKQQGRLGEPFARLVEPFNDCVALIESSRDMVPVPFNYDGQVEPIGSHNFKHFLHTLYLSDKGHSEFEQINDVFNKDPFKLGIISFGKPGNQLEVMIQQNGIRLPIKHMGSGVLQFLYIIARAIHTKSRVICIEELEQNLSPKNQELVLAKLQSMIADKANNIDQVIISSHSPVYADGNLGAVYLLEKKGDITRNQSRLTKKMNEGFKEHLFPAALPPDTYTDEEFEERRKELDRITEEMFRR